MPSGKTNIYKKIDTFGVGVKFLIDGDETYKTNTGAFFSLIAYIFVATYFSFEVFNMFTYNNTTFAQTTVTNYFS